MNKLGESMKKFNMDGFDENGIHKYTGTKYDEFGFNKNGTSHKDTNSACDQYGIRREYYKRYRGCLYFNVLLNRLFWKSNFIEFDGENFSDVNLSYKRVGKIQLDKFQRSTQMMHDGPTKLDGTPDYRYHNTFINQEISEYTLQFYLRDQKDYVNKKYKIDLYYSEDEIKKKLLAYNNFLFSFNDGEFTQNYENLLALKQQCANIEEALANKHQDFSIKKDLYEKLSAFINELPEKEKEKLLILKIELDDLQKEIVDFELFKSTYKQNADTYFFKLQERVEMLHQEGFYSIMGKSIESLDELLKTLNDVIEKKND